MATAQDTLIVVDGGDATVTDDGEEIDVPTTSYGLNHPKSYIGYTVALKKGGDRETADDLCEEYVVGAPDMARRGAMNMGMIESPSRGEYQLTDHGADICTRALDLFPGNNYTQVLEFFEGLKGSRKRFVDKCPEWADLAPDIMQGDPAAERLVDLMQDIHERREVTADDDEEGLMLWECFREMKTDDPHFAVELFIRDNAQIREAVLGSADPSEWDESWIEMDYDALQSGTIELEGEEYAVYRSPTVHIWKNLLFHMGVLTTTGREAAKIDPETNLWGLEPSLRTGDAE